MNRRMKALRVLPALLAIAGHHATAQATDNFWLLIGQSGTKPNRVAYYAFDGWLFDRSDPAARAAEIMRNHDPKTIEARMKALRQVELEVLQVFESPQSPAFMRMYLIFDCGKRLFQVREAEAIARNGVPHRSARQDWQAISNNWLDRAHFVACEEEVWRSAGADDIRNRAPGRGQPKLSAHGIAMIGQWTGQDMEPQVDHFTWNNIWTDGVRPPFTNNRTAREEEIYQEHIARNARIMEENKRAAALGAGMTTGLMGQLKGMDEEKAFKDKIAANFRKGDKGGDKDWVTLQGLSEENIVGMWGPPDATSTHGSTKILRYTPESDTRETLAIRDGAGNLVGHQQVGERQACLLTFTFRIGGNRPEWRLYDYEIRGDGSNLRDGMLCTKEVLYSRVRSRSRVDR